MANTMMTRGTAPAQISHKIPSGWEKPKFWFGSKVIVPCRWSEPILQHKPLIGIVLGMEWYKYGWSYVVDFLRAVDGSSVPIQHSDPEIVEERFLESYLD
ncbi:MAG: hypothetical protein SAJ37_08895 [Oscillatoria sp. PMC 1068.18]|nr:hypothetical protein [Oscillatoria sp. PMC 1068.18]